MSNLKRKVKFQDPLVTINGEPRAHVELKGLKTLWFNTGTVCNLTCANCYIESSPTNDRLAYISHQEVCQFLDEIERDQLPTTEIGLTGGEPFINPDIIAISKECLERGFSLLILTNAMRPMMKRQKELLELKRAFSAQLRLRVSVDHFEQKFHEDERGPKSWAPMLLGLKWLSDNGFTIDAAGRTRWGESEAELRAGYAKLFKDENININAADPRQLVLFPEMDENTTVPEISTGCWEKVGVSPDDMMCASSRMVVKPKNSNKPVVQACTLLAYEQEFNLGYTLEEASRSVSLNHPHCAKFCVLGGGSCSR